MNEERFREQQFMLVASDGRKNKKKKKDKGVSYWRVEGVNALVLVYLVGPSWDVDRVQVFRQRRRFHDEENTMPANNLVDISLSSLDRSQREDPRELR